MIIPGYRASRELLLHVPDRVRTVYLGEYRKDQRIREMENLAKKNGITVTRAGSSFFKKFKAVSGEFAVEIDRILILEESDFLNKALGANLLLIEEVTDPHNLGSLLRVAECSGFHHVALTKHHTAPVNEVVVSASAGAAVYLNLGRIHNVRSLLKTLKAEGYWILGTAMNGHSIFKTSPPEPYCIIMGSEDRGMKNLTMQTCDELVSLPLKGNIESLNVSTAASALLYELLRKKDRDS